MKKSFKFLCMLAAVCVLASCSSKEDGPKGFEPEADFSFKTTSKLEAKFTNTSLDAESYEWSFGDGQTSSEENPTHTYTAIGTYQVTLRATNGSFDNELTKTIDYFPAIDIDKDFSDWGKISGFTWKQFVEGPDKLPGLLDGQRTEDGQNAVVAVKASHDSKYLYIYCEVVEGCNVISPMFRFNPDGANYWNCDWIYAQTGIDAFSEIGDLAVSLDTWVIGVNGDVGTNVIKEYTDISWVEDQSHIYIDPGMGTYLASGLKATGRTHTMTGAVALTLPTYELEFAISREVLASVGLTVTPDYNFGIRCIDLGWASMGNLPKSAGADAKMFTYTLSTNKLSF